MENIGVCVDRQGIESYGEMLSAQIKELETAIYESAGCEFNINSPKQLGVVLFENLGLPCKKKTKSGYSTNAEVLESLRYEHPVVEMVLRYRTLSKLNSTYCEGLLKVIADDGRIHSNFNQTETRTGRISSTEPNLQNIPVRTELGREMRKFFCARDGWALVDADYSQIELRVLAHISGDKNMIKAFKDNEDIHAITASQVFNMPLDMVTPIMRSRAKAVNFGIVYGIGAFSLAKDHMLARGELGKISSSTEHRFNIAVSVRFFDNIFHIAVNAAVMGTAADIIKIAMIKVDERMKSENLRARLVLQVHDELIVEAPQDESMRVALIVQEEMENAVKMSVPLTADAAIGRTWYDEKG